MSVNTEAEVMAKVIIKVEVIKKTGVAKVAGTEVVVAGFVDSFRMF
jgi:hypothetical protein